MKDAQETESKPFPTSVLLDLDTKETLDRVAEDEDRSRSAVVRRAIVSYAETRASLSRPEGAS